MKVGKVYGLQAEDLGGKADDALLIEILEGLAEAQGKEWSDLSDGEQKAAMDDLKAAIRGSKLQ